ncbi:uncharacterized protein LOC119606267 [Lucilia sericata]|uniref:uncharacterized protein LOC119606267 n=1 Tax=Lucilia sericata TaxID=13632 RepID=UPI0018A87564|nr:uncharacterized protein LOC119606267 [Lucilia sericata]
MLEHSESHKLNEFGFMDYKKPLGNEQDMRTSTYLGHKIMGDTMLNNKIQPMCKETKSYEEDAVLEKHRTSDYKANYVWKFGIPDEIRNVSLDRKIHYMKPFYDCNLKFLKRPMRPASSVTHSDYIWQPENTTLPPAIPHIPCAVSPTKIVVDRNKPGYSKLLDPSATTTSLDYCYRSPQDIMNSIAANDNITFWNWKDTEYREKKVFRVKEAQLCDKLPSKDCTKRRCEFPSKVKAVPNSGLITEVRENYVNPNERIIDYDNSYIKNDLTFVASEPLMAKTEYNVLGSGECTQKFV